MTTFSLLKNLGLALGCAALACISSPVTAADIRANGGTTWTLDPTAEPGVFMHTVDGIAQTSLLGNCTVHADVVVRFSDQPPTLNGSFVFTTADGTTTLTATAEGTGTPDPENPNAFLNFQYQVRFTGGSGQFASARGNAEIDGAALFTSPSTGKAAWKLKGQVLGINNGKK